MRQCQCTAGNEWVCDLYLYKTACIYTQLICVAGNKRVQSSVSSQLRRVLRHQCWLPSSSLLFFFPPPLFLLLFQLPLLFLLSRPFFFLLLLPLFLLLSPSSLLFLCFLLSCSKTSLRFPFLLLPLFSPLLFQQSPLPGLLLFLFPLLLFLLLFVSSLLLQLCASRGNKYTRLMAYSVFTNQAINRDNTKQVMGDWE